MRKSKTRSMFLRQVSSALEMADKGEQAEGCLDNGVDYRILFQTMAQGMVCQDSEGRIVLANAAACRILGMSMDQMMGLTSLDPRWRAIREDGSAYPGSEHPAVTVRLTGKPVTGEIIGVFIPAEGRHRWVSVNAMPIFQPGDPKLQYVCITFQDITRRIEAERTKLNYQTLFEHSPDPVMMVEPSGRIILCSPALADLLGYSRQEIIGQSIQDIEVGAAPGVISGLVSKASEDSFTDSEIVLKIQQRGPRVYWVKVVAAVRPGSKETLILFYFRDISERKKVEALKDDFVSMVSHQLRTPLTIIMGAVNTALSEWDSISAADQKSLLTDASSEAERLNVLINNLLELTRIKAGRLTLYKKKTRLDGLLRKIINRQRAMSPGRRVTLKAPKDLPLVEMDQVRIEHVLDNLLDNALKYSPEGSEVRVVVSGNDGKVEIGVEDKGPGLTLDEQNRLFVPFERLNQSLGGYPKGLGLGLVVCRKLVEAHDGTISVSSARGKGSVFKIVIPSWKSGPDQVPKPGGQQMASRGLINAEISKKTVRKTPRKSRVRHPGARSRRKE
jgi:PAS domain S-box-containing protein